MLYSLFLNDFLLFLHIITSYIPYNFTSMKEKEVKVDCEEQQVVIFAEKDDSSYGPVQTGSYITKNYLEDFQLKQQHLEENLVKKLMAGEISPVCLFMTLEDISISELAKRSSIPKYKVKKHLQPGGFDKARISDIKKYAEVFNIPLANLFQLIHTSQDEKWKSHYRKPEGKTHHDIEQLKTANPLLVITQIEQKEQ